MYSFLILFIILLNFLSSINLSFSFSCFYLILKLLLIFLMLSLEFMFGSIPISSLDSFDEDVDRGAFRHCRRSLQVLVHAPELIDGAEVC